MVPAPAKPTSKGPEKGSSRAWDGLTPALSEWVLDAVSSMGFTRMTPVQASTIPLFSRNSDVVVEAVTGSGKTMSFLIPVIERLLRLSDPIRKHHVGAIIISPTRELATQIHSVLLSLLAFHAPSAAALRLNAYDSDTEMDGDSPAPEFPPSTLKILPQLLLGGTTKPAQDLSTFLKTSPNLLVATPGRLLELLTSPHVHCPQSSFEVLVMDEADRLLDMGFKDDLQKILQRLPKQRRTGLFSASVSEAVDQLIRVGLRNPVRISVKVKSNSGALDKRTPASLQMSYLITPPSHKLPTISKLLNNLTPTPQKTIVYLSTCAAVDYFQHLLPILLPGFTIVPLHGQLPSKVRQKNFERFLNSVMPAVLVTTDVAARGLDIPAVDLVVQIDPPSDPKTFLHRCGRAGRAGRKGLAVTILTPGREEDYIAFMDVRKTPITPLESPDVSVSESEVEIAVKTMRDTVLQDRALHDKAQRGFVSWLRSYSKHTASSIFRVADLDWTEQGRGWGLLKLPKMPELKGWEGDRSLGVSMDFSEFAYKDKQREKLRREALENAAAGALEFRKDALKAKKSKARSEAWSDKKGRLDLRQERREKKQTRREKERLDKMNEEERAEALRLQGMIETVRKKVKSAEAADEEWEGFSD